MSRLPRMVLPGIPHHVTQRGNRRERTFFEDGDYALYLDLLADGAERAGIEIWSYCLMPITCTSSWFLATRMACGAASASCTGTIRATSTPACA